MRYGNEHIVDLRSQMVQSLYHVAQLDPVMRYGRLHFNDLFNHPRYQKNVSGELLGHGRRHINHLFQSSPDVQAAPLHRPPAEQLRREVRAAPQLPARQIRRPSAGSTWRLSEEWLVTVAKKCALPPPVSYLLIPRAMSWTGVHILSPTVVHLLSIFHLNFSCNLFPPSRNWLPQTWTLEMKSRWKRGRGGGRRCCGKLDSSPTRDQDAQYRTQEQGV